MTFTLATGVFGAPGHGEENDSPNILYISDDFHIMHHLPI